jgi:hypothetical protein
VFRPLKNHTKIIDFSSANKILKLREKNLHEEMVALIVSIVG